VARQSHPTGTRSGAVSSQGSVVGILCNREVLLFSGNTTKVSLPNLPSYAVWASENNSSGPYSTIELAKPLWGTSQGSLTNITALTTLWIPLSDEMTSVTTGLVILGPQNSTNSTERYVVVCSIDAWWNTAEHTMTESFITALGNVGDSIAAAGSGQTLLRAL